MLNVLNDLSRDQVSGFRYKVKEYPAAGGTNNVGFGFVGVKGLWSERV